MAAIRELVAEGKADSVSGFVQHAVQNSLDELDQWSSVQYDGAGHS